VISKDDPVATRRATTPNVLGRPSRRLARVLTGGRPALAAGRPALAAGAAVIARVLTAAGLGIDAFVHVDLASTYAESGGTVNEGTLFRLEAVLASLAALAVILVGRRLWFLLALAISVTALAVMLVSTYVDLGALGPFPDLYDPVWFTEKLWAAFAEGSAAVAALAAAILCSVREKR
jgi:hypothetical protein